MKGIILIISIFYSLISWATSVQSNIDAYLSFSYDSLDKELIQRHAGAVNEYLERYRGPQDAEYQGLLRLHANAQNYLAIEKVLSECNDNDRQLSVRILGVVGNQVKMVGTSVVPCQIYNKPYEDIERLVEAGRNVINPMLSNSMQEDIYQRSLINSFKSLMHHKYLYGQRAFRGDFAIKRLIDEYCDEECSPDFYNPENFRESKLFKELKAYWPTLPGMQQYNTNTAAQRINNFIDGENGLNSILSAAEETIDIDEGLVWDSPEFQEDTVMTMQMYQMRYNQIASQDVVGRLLNTEVIRDQVRAPRQPSSSDVDQEGNSFRFKKHRRVTPDQISRGIEEVDDMIKDQIGELNDVDESRRRQAQRDLGTNNNYRERNFVNNRNTDLKKLLRTNPAAIGQQLFEKPYYAHKVCELIGGVTTDDEQEAFVDNIWFYGGMIVGGALLVTGIGAGVGAWIMMGTAAGATMATVAATTGIVGTLVGLSEAGYHTHEYFESRAERTAIEGAILTGGGDNQSIQELQDAITDMREAGYSAIMAGAFSAVELGTIYGAAKVYFRGARLAGGVDNLGRANLVTRTLQTIAENPRFIVTMNRLKRAVGSEKMAKFIGHLSNASEVVRLQILNRLAALATKGDMDGLQRMVNEALEIAQRTCRS